MGELTEWSQHTCLDTNQLLLLWWCHTGRGLFWQTWKRGWVRLNNTLIGKLTLLGCQLVTWSKAEGQQSQCGAEKPHGFTSRKTPHLASPRLTSPQPPTDGWTEKEKVKKVKSSPHSVSMPPSLLTRPTAVHYAWLLNRHWCIFMSQSQLMC